MIALPAYLLTAKAKLIGVGLLLLLGFLWLKNHDRRLTERVRVEQRNSDILEQQKAIAAKEAEFQATLAQERMELETQRTALAAERSALVAQRREISSAVRAGIAEVSGKGQAIETELRNVPASGLDARAREALGRARTADAALARLRAQ